MCRKLLISSILHFYETVSNTENPMFVSLKCRVYADHSGAYSEVPAILTPSGWLMPLLDYCLAHRHARSRAWMQKVIRSVRLFLMYLVANPDEKDSVQLFQNFVQRLYSGTFDLKTGFDPSWLCWRPRSAVEVRNIVRDLTDFFDWLGEKRPTVATVNPRYSGNTYDQLADELAYQFRRNQAFLGHTWEPHSGRRKSHLVRARRPPKVERSEPPAFPEQTSLTY